MEKFNRKNTSEKVGIYWCALFYDTVQSSSICKLIFISYHNITVERDNLTYPPSSEYLCPKARMSEARPLPSHTTTGTGGVSLRYSSTIEITFGPPSTIRATTGTPCPIPVEKTETWERNVSEKRWNVCDRGGGYYKENQSKRLKVKGAFFLLYQFNVQRTRGKPFI